MPLDCGIGGLAVISTIGCETINPIIELIAQCFQLTDIACILINENLRKDLTGIGINGNMELAPLSTPFYAVLSSSHWPAP